MQKYTKDIVSLNEKDRRYSNGKLAGKERVKCLNIVTGKYFSLFALRYRKRKSFDFF